MVIHGYPCHSQSQGLVEKGNHCVEMQIQAMHEKGMEWHRNDGLIGCHVFNV